jgi:hypothetical protein
MSVTKTERKNASSPFTAIAASGTLHVATLKRSIPENTVISWTVENKK